MNNNRYYLLTGATGYLGSHILRTLERRSLKVICLVRSEEKLQNVLKYYFPRGHVTFD